jgi:hypothetical protein
MVLIPILDIPVLNVPVLIGQVDAAFIEIAMCNKTEDKWLWAIMWLAPSR